MKTQDVVAVGMYAYNIPVSDLENIKRCFFIIVCAFLCVHVYVYMCMCVHVCVRMCGCAYIYMYTYIYIHIHMPMSQNIATQVDLLLTRKSTDGQRTSDH